MGEVKQEPQPPPGRYSDLPKKIEFFLNKKQKDHNQFIEEMVRIRTDGGTGENAKHIRKSTILSWLGLAENKNVRSQIPFRRPDTPHGKFLDEYFGRLFGFEQFPSELWHLPYSKFEGTAEEKLKDKPPTRLIVPVARRLGEMRPEHTELLSGKYLLYRPSMRKKDHLISEVFTLTPSNQVGCLDMKLRSSPEETEDHEVYIGSFFRCGKMYWSVLTYSVNVGGGIIKDFMRMIHFPEVSNPQGVYFGLVTSDAFLEVRAVAVRCFAVKFTEETEFEAKDDEQVWIVAPDEAPPHEPMIDLQTVRTVLCSGDPNGMAQFSTVHDENDVLSLTRWLSRQKK